MHRMTAGCRLSLFPLPPPRAQIHTQGIINGSMESQVHVIQGDCPCDGVAGTMQFPREGGDGQEQGQTPQRVVAGERCPQCPLVLIHLPLRGPLPSSETLSAPVSLCCLYCAGFWWSLGLRVGGG